MLEKGIILIATGHPYYGRMAYNLALTIKAVEKFPVAVVHDDTGLKHLTLQQRAIFDYELPIVDNIPAGYHTKLHLDILSPFDRTLYLDVDMLWLQGLKPSDLFNELQGVSYTGITEGKTGDVNLGYYFWADESEILKVFKVDTVHQWRSEVIYFEKPATVFKKARKLNPDVALKSVKKFGGTVPDELYFNIATAQLNVNPHKYKWTPAYWPRLHKEQIPQHLNGYYLISFGSNYATPVMKKNYARIVQVAANKMGIVPLFGLHSKRDYMPERKKM